MKTLFFDTETSNLIANSLRPLDKQPEIIQWYGVIYDGVEASDDLNLYIKPKKPVTKEIEKITGITNEFLADKSPFADVAAQIKTQIESVDLCVAHNASFDRDVTNIEFARLGMSIEWPELFCTVEQTEPIYGYRVKLGDLFKVLFDKPMTGAHNAKTDVEGLAACYWKLKEENLI